MRTRRAWLVVFTLLAMAVITVQLTELLVEGRPWWRLPYAVHARRACAARRSAG